MRINCVSAVKQDLGFSVLVLKLSLMEETTCCFSQHLCLRQKIRVKLWGEEDYALIIMRKTNTSF